MKKVFSLTLIVTLLTFIIALFHLNNGEGEMLGRFIEKFNLASKPWLFTLLLPAYGLLMSGIVVYFKRQAIHTFYHDTDQIENNQKHQMTLAVCILFGPLLALVLQSVLFMVDSGWLGKQSLLHAVEIVVLSYVFFMGNSITATRRESGSGFRTPWALANDHIWHKTQRYLGRCLVTLSILGLGGMFFLPPMKFLMILMAILITIKISTLFYSWLLWRQDQQKNFNL